MSGVRRVLTRSWRSSGTCAEAFRETPCRIPGPLSLLAARRGRRSGNRSHYGRATAQGHGNRFERWLRGGSGVRWGGGRGGRGGGGGGAWVGEAGASRAAGQSRG